MTRSLYVLIQHDGYDIHFTLAGCTNRETLEKWKSLLDNQDRNSPAKRSGEFFEIEQIPFIFASEKPSISGIRELLGLDGQDRETSK